MDGGGTIAVIYYKEMRVVIPLAEMMINLVEDEAHSCYDNRMPGKKDDVSFVVTRIDAERNVAVGLISRIIKQNI